MKGTIVLLICICLSGCSSLNYPENGGGQRTSVSEPGAETTWYCYSTTDSNKWNCQDESDPTKILSLKQVGLKKVATRSPFASRKPRAPGPQHQRAKQAPAHQSVQSTQPQQAAGRPQQSQSAMPARQVASVTPPSSPAKRSSAPQNPDASQGATSILQQPAGFYAVQLIALQDQHKVLQYAKDHGLKYPLCAQIRSNSEIWYVLLLGVYPDRLSAARAKDEWSTNKNLSVKPWIRQLGPLQDAIRLAVR